jgi:hypothetical protein
LKIEQTGMRSRHGAAKRLMARDKNSSGGRKTAVHNLCALRHEARCAVRHGIH